MTGQRHGWQCEGLLACRPVSRLLVSATSLSQGSHELKQKCCNKEEGTVEKEVQGFSYCIKRNVSKQKFHQRKKGSEKEIAFMQQLCCSVLQRCWHDYRSIRRIKEAVLQMTAALAKSYFFIVFASGNSDSSAKALYLSGGR